MRESAFAAVVPALKMRWVEGGIRLNEFVEDYLDHPRMLKQLLALWPKMASRLRRKKITHADLQHGNVLLVPRSDKRLALRLIDYDGMHVPALAGAPSAELGHPAFQHPQRSREGIYSAEIDRFSHLAIYTAVHSLTVGGKELWDRFNNGDNLLFREDDFQDPANSEIFHTLWEVPDAACRSLVGRLALACEAPLDRTPLLKDITNGKVRPLPAAEQKAAQRILGTDSAVIPATVVEPSEQPPTEPEPVAQSKSEESQRTVQKSQGPLDLARGEVIRTPMQPETVEENADAEVQPRRLAWPTPLSILRVLDWPLKKIAGEDNEILHDFLRILVPVATALLVFFAMTDWSQWFANGTLDTTLIVNEAAQEICDSEGRITNGIGMKFKPISAGGFMMGSPEGDPDKSSDQAPQHRVRITKPFYLGIHEVTQEQYERVMGENPSRFEGATHPVEKVSWKDANQFCEKLSEMDEKYDYRLPTEAEWEYACQAGTSTRFSCGDELDPACAWFSDNSDGQTHPVGEKHPNAFGLYDMHGNVREWCSDWHDGDYYGSSPSADPRGPSSGSSRVYRGGGWNDAARNCRSVNRSSRAPGFPDDGLGFRVVLVTAKRDSSAESTASPPKSEPNISPPPQATKLPGDHTDSIDIQSRFISAEESLVSLQGTFAANMTSVTNLKPPAVALIELEVQGADGNALPEWLRNNYTIGATVQEQNDVRATRYIDLSDLATENEAELYDGVERVLVQVHFVQKQGLPTSRSRDIVAASYCWGEVRIESSHRYDIRFVLAPSAVSELEKRAERYELSSPEPEPDTSPASTPSIESAIGFPETHTNAIGMQFKLIPAGEFMMGSSDDDLDKKDDEIPQHRVQITKPFYLGIHEVTQEQYEKVMGENPAHFKGPTHPVEQVSWEDANQFCAKLSEMVEKCAYRLPTEAQWEYACRAGTTTRFSCGDKLDPACACFLDNSGGQTHPVSEEQLNSFFRRSDKKRPNAFGLYDMHGNVWEWCSDWYSSEYYGSSPSADPTGPLTGSNRVLRGGSWDHSARLCRSAIRHGFKSNSRFNYLGFRVALVQTE